MKGIVFTEFLELVEKEFGLEIVNEIIESSDLKSKGVYTSIGTYQFYEMLQLITSLSKKVSIPADDLIFVFGQHFFDYLNSTYPKIFESYETPVHFLKSVEGHIHVQVRKIYPDAELPTFLINDVNSNKFEMIYKSKRALYRFAEALIRKTFEHYNIAYVITFEKIIEDGSEVKFTITHNA